MGGHLRTHTAPPPPCHNNGKSTENDRNNNSCCCDRDVVCADREKAQAAKQCINEPQTAMSMEVHQSHVLKGGVKVAGQSPALPDILSPAPNQGKNLMCANNQKMVPPNFNDSEGCGPITSCCSDKGVVRRGGGGGGVYGLGLCCQKTISATPGEAENHKSRTPQGRQENLGPDK